MPHIEIYHELLECQKTGEFVAYHKWGDDPGIFLVGRIVDMTPTKATFQTINANGTLGKELDAAPLRLIHTLDRGTLYLGRLQVLHDLGPVVVSNRDVRKAREIRALLEEAAREEAIVRLWTSAEEEDDFLVRAVGEETVVVSQVFDAGPANGRTILRLKRIVRVRWGSHEADHSRAYRYGLDHGSRPVY